MTALYDTHSLDLPSTAWEVGSLVSYRDTVYVIWADPNKGGLLHLAFPEYPGLPVLWSIPWAQTHPL